MNETASQFTDNSSTESLREEIKGLKNTLTLTLLLLFVFSFSVNVFLFRQASVMGSQVGEAEQVINGFQNGGAQQMVEFWSKLNDYAKTHPDFAPVIQKYGQFIRTNPTPKK